MTNPSIQHLSEHALLKIKLQDAQYGVDLALFNDGKDLSAELLKLALAGIAVVGALLSLRIDLGLTICHSRYCFPVRSSHSPLPPEPHCCNASSHQAPCSTTSRQ